MRKPVPGRRAAQPCTIIGKVLADGGRRQHRFHLRHGIDDGGNEGIRVRPRPGAIVAEIAIFVAVDRGLNFRDELGCTPAIRVEHFFG